MSSFWSIPFFYWISCFQNSFLTYLQEKDLIFCSGFCLQIYPVCWRVVIFPLLSFMKPFKRVGKRIEKAIFSRGNGSYGNRQYFLVLVQRSDTPEKLTRLCKSP